MNALRKRRQQLLLHWLKKKIKKKFETSKHIQTRSWLLPEGNFGKPNLQSILYNYI